MFEDYPPIWFKGNTARFMDKLALFMDNMQEVIDPMAFMDALLKDHLFSWLKDNMQEVIDPSAFIDKKPCWLYVQFVGITRTTYIPKSVHADINFFPVSRTMGYEPFAGVQRH